MSDERDWERFGTIVRQRRLALGRSQAELGRLCGGLSLITIRRIETGQQVRDLTVHRLDRGLDWERGSAWAVLHGDEPTEAGAQAPAPKWTRRDLAALRKIIEESDESDEEKARLRARVWQLERDLDERERTFEASPEL